MKIEHFFTPYTKTNSEWIKNLNVRPEPIKFLEENIGRTLFDINCNNIILDLSPQVKEIKAKINKWESFYTAKETIDKMQDNLLSGKKKLTNGIWSTRG